MDNNIRKISFFDEFTCLGGQCEETCCFGWQILVDDKALMKYRSVKGFLGLRLKSAFVFKDEPVLNLREKKCPFHTRNGLCELQQKLGEAYQPEVCRIYPRYWRNYGPFTEIWLDLSCIRAAELFLIHQDSFSMAEPGPKALLATDKGQAEALARMVREGNNDDFSFLDQLEQSRREILSQMDTLALAGDCREVDHYYHRLLDYAIEAQNACIHGQKELPDPPLFEKRSKVTSILNEDRSRQEETAADMDSRQNASDASGTGDRYKAYDASGMGDRYKAYDASGTGDRETAPHILPTYPCFPFSAALFHKLISSDFYSERLEKRSPFLYRLCRFYYDTLGHLSETERQNALNRLIHDFFSEGPCPIAKYLHYHQMGIYREYLNIFEDYSFLPWILKGITDVNMILLLDLLYWQEHKTLSWKDQAHIIASYER
ncbi:MAG: flagellin lysine-N-methylase, partial [Lachnospiraceae bacterium]|nr:flagellin lysine-N-methylase [Lachnospiraceae bacterium]